MTVGYLDIGVHKGSQLTQPILVTTNGDVVPLVSGTGAKMQIRSSAKSDTILAELSSDNGRLLVDVDAATVTIKMTAAYTATFDFERARYDLMLLPPGGENEVIVEGKVFVLSSVTQTS